MQTIFCPHCRVEQLPARVCLSCKTTIIHTMAEVQQNHFQRAYNVSRRNMEVAAMLIGVPYSTFRRRMLELQAGKVVTTKQLRVYGVKRKRRGNLQ